MQKNNFCYLDDITTKMARAILFRFGQEKDYTRGDRIHCRLYLKLPDVQLEYDDEFLYIHSKKEAKIPLADLTYVHITAELPFLLHESFLREILIHFCSDEYGKIDLDVDGFGSYKLYFVPHAKDMESELLGFFNSVMNNT